MTDRLDAPLMLLLVSLAVVSWVVVSLIVVLARRRRGVEAVALRAPGAGESRRAVTLPPKSSLLRQVNDSEIEAQIRSGYLIDAIKLYRAKNGVGLKEAKDAVEAWRDRMRAS